MQDNVMGFSMALGCRLRNFASNVMLLTYELEAQLRRQNFRCHFVVGTRNQNHIRERSGKLGVES